MEKKNNQNLDFFKLLKITFFCFYIEKLKLLVNEKA